MTAPSREEIQRKFEELHRRGIVNLDEPLRESIPELAAYINKYAAREADWWILAEGEDPHAVCECHW